MNRFFCILIWICLPFYATGQTDSLLRELDRVIQNRSQYQKAREIRIDSLKTLFELTGSKEEKYKVLYRVFREYRSYNMDSALSVAIRKKALAEETGIQRNIHESEMSVAEILGIMGMYKESLEIMDRMDFSKLDEQHKAFYFHLHHSLYTRLSENMASEKGPYEKLLSTYRDSLLQYNEKGTTGYDFALAGKLAELKQYEKAMQVFDRMIGENRDNLSILAMAAYELSEIYRKRGETEDQKKNLILSATADVKRGARTYVSLIKLAILLYREGDVDRAYQYITCAMEDAAYSKSRFRTLQISEALPVIIDAYDKKMKEEKANLFKSLMLISFLSLILVLSLVFIYRQMKKLSLARKEVSRMLEDVKQMNTELYDLNEKLSDTHRIKEEYIGFIFNLCSDYIDKMENYRKEIHRKLKAGKANEALQLTGSTSLVTDELKEFFRNFDAVFLTIFPNFVEEFNHLLLEGEKILPKPGDLLSPELRVFALVRLGITESSKIANFLHYSPQTVYNYNLKVRNKLAISKEKFAELIHVIGR